MGRSGERSANLLGQQNLDDVAAVAVFDQANSAAIDKTTQGSTSGVTANTDAFGEPNLREAEAMAAFEPGVAKKMRIDGAVGDVETQVGHDEVVELFPHMYRVG